MQKRLYRSKRERVIAGVCGGLAEYLDVDPTIIRLAWVIFCLMGGAGVLAYFIAMIIIPENPQEKAPKREQTEERCYHDERNGTLIGGLILLFVGTFFLLNNFGLLAWFNWWVFWSMILIAIGVVLIIPRSRK